MRPLTVTNALFRFSKKYGSLDTKSKFIELENDFKIIYNYCLDLEKQIADLSQINDYNKFGSDIIK